MHKLHLPRAPASGFKLLDGLWKIEILPDLGVAVFCSEYFKQVRSEVFTALRGHISCAPAPREKSPL